MRKTKNADLIQEAIDLLNDLEYIQYRAPYVLKELKQTTFSKKEIEENNINYLIEGLDI